MRNRNWIALGAIVFLALISSWINLPIQHPEWASQLLVWQQPPESRNLEIKQGLDLQGGTQVLLQAEPSPGQALTEQDMKAAIAIVERRVNALGVTEPVVQQVGENRVMVQLPGIDNPQQAIDTLQSTGQLEFVEIGSSTSPEFPNVAQGVYLRTTNQAAPLTAEQLGTSPNPYPDHVFTTLITGRELKTAAVQLDQVGKPGISFELKTEGAKIFGDYTKAHVGDILAIVLDNIVLSNPVIQTAIPDGQGQITGKFMLQEAESLAIQMRYGALPVPLLPVSVQTVGATLGADSVQKSITAGLIGLVTVLLFMSVYYRLPGVLAAIALMIYVSANLLLYKLIPITLTLPGIAGFLLSTGMAVDANILIFERMKEELRWGRPLGSAVEAGFNRAWTSVLDSNLSVLITCAILIVFGSTRGAQAVMGFGVTLALGVLVSMFTAVVVTRTLMRAVFERSGADAMREKRWLLGF